MRPAVREGLIAAAYLLLVATGVLTVLLPALEDDRDLGSPTAAEAGAEAAADAGM